jgi:endonuclease/exonuclease/phosphatase family metal-dependent hydrolase
MSTLRICTYNIHKGLAGLKRRVAIHELRERLRTLDPDIAFLQEVQGLHLRHAQRLSDWPAEPQHEFLASGRWHSAYGGNAAYDHGHHGNAVLSLHPIIFSANHDVSLYRLERRGILHCEIGVPNMTHSVHGICVHLSLTEYQRRRQLELLIEHVKTQVPPNAPLVIAGDFNDWRSLASDFLKTQLGVREAFTEVEGKPARSYPSNLPMLRLDRIYLRGLMVEKTEVHSGSEWSTLSDHAPLTAVVRVLQ